MSKFIAGEVLYEKELLKGKPGSKVWKNMWKKAIDHLVARRKKEVKRGRQNR